MERASTSRSDQVTSGQPQGHTYFPNARDFSFLYPVFNDVTHHHTERTVFDDLKSHISEAAMHDSLARYPPPRCHPKTRKKVLKVITNWIEDSNPRQRIMWLNGPAGAGKSAIAQTIAERYKDSRVAASFFFLRNTSDRGVADRLFTTLAWQLGASIPETLPYIELALKTERLLHTKSIGIQFDYLVTKVFENLLRDNPEFRPEKSLVIIDGVDECATEKDQNLFLTLIADQLARTKIPLRFLICSRPESHIEETFNMENMKDITRTVVLDEKFAPSDDIRRYLEDELFRIFTKRHISPLPSDSDIQHLVAKASGQFIYAATVIKFIDDDDCDPREQLDIILKLRPVNSSSPYAQLDQLYIQILSQQPDVRLLRDIFVLIIALGEPRFQFICRRLRINEEKLRRKLRKMHSLLRISESDSNILTYHRSLHDFFQDKKRSGEYRIHPMRVALVRLPKRTRPIVKTVGQIGFAFLFATRVLISPLFLIIAICYNIITCGSSSDTAFADFVLAWPLPYPTIE